MFVTASGWRGGGLDQGTAPAPRMDRPFTIPLFIQTDKA